MLSVVLYRVEVYFRFDVVLFYINQICSTHTHTPRRPPFTVCADMQSIPAQHLSPPTLRSGSMLSVLKLCSFYFKNLLTRCPFPSYSLLSNQPLYVLPPYDRWALGRVKLEPLRKVARSRLLVLLASCVDGQGFVFNRVIVSGSAKGDGFLRDVLACCFGDWDFLLIMTLLVVDLTATHWISFSFCFWTRLSLYGHSSSLPEWCYCSCCVETMISFINFSAAPILSFSKITLIWVTIVRNKKTESKFVELFHTDVGSSECMCVCVCATWPWRIN